MKNVSKLKGERMKKINWLSTLLLCAVCIGCGGVPDNTPLFEEEPNIEVGNSNEQPSTPNLDDEQQDLNGNENAGALPNEDNVNELEYNDDLNSENGNTDSESTESENIPDNTDQGSNGENSVGESNNESNQEPSFSGDPLSGSEHYTDLQCNSCHGDSGEGAIFTAIDGICEITNCQDEVILSQYITEYMPLGGEGSCDTRCGIDIAAFMLNGFSSELIDESVEDIVDTNSSDPNPSEPDEIDPLFTNPFSCTDSQVSDAPTWRRLSHLQYVNTLQDFVRYSVANETVAESILDGITELLRALPQESRPQLPQDLHGSFRRLDQVVSQTHVEAWFDVSLALSNQLTDDAHIQSLVGTCYNSTQNISACVSDFIERVGLLAFRRPLDSSETTFFLDIYQSVSGLNTQSPTAYSQVLATMLNSPQFLYITEHGVNNDNSLSAYELANRLSYHFWNSMPDSQLLASAQNGSLLQDNIYDQQVNRLFDDPKTQSTVREFYREWLKLENLEALDANNHLANFIRFAGDDLPSSTLHTEMQNEVLDLLDYGTWSYNFSIQDVFTTQLLFPVTQGLADIYGVNPQASGVGVLAPNNDRPGVLTRAGLTASRGMVTHPIQKGVFIRETILCDEIPSPPEGVTENLPELANTLTTREQVEAITEQPDTACAACHQAVINDLGYPTENFDALGRVRYEQPFIDDAGNIFGTGVVNTTSTPKVELDDFTEVQDANGLMDLIVASNKPAACISRHYFRFSFSRWEDLQNDGCALHGIYEGLTENHNLQDMLRSVAHTAAFKRR